MNLLKFNFWSIPKTRISLHFYYFITKIKITKKKISIRNDEWSCPRSKTWAGDLNLDYLKGCLLIFLLVDFELVFAMHDVEL